MLALSSSSLLRTGSEIMINGLVHRLVVLAGQDTAFLPPAALAGGRPLHARELDAFRASLGVLDELCQKATLLNERLLDPLDGATGRSVASLMASPTVSAEFRTAMIPYAFALYKHGCNVITERGSVIVPPAPREAFAREVARLPAQQRGTTRWKAVLDHLFEAVPRVTQGFYLFERPEDLARFDASLGEDYAELCVRLRRLFADAVEQQHALPRGEWTRLDDLSQRALEVQKAALERALEASDADVRSSATRVRIRCYDDGQIRFWSVPFAMEFEEELAECATLLRRTRGLVPGFATQLREVLFDLAEWCEDDSDKSSWGESRTSWIAADDPDNLLDVNLTVEEKVSRLGAKGGFQLVVSEFHEPPGATGSVYELVREEGRKRQSLNVVFLRQLLVGGGASNALLAGEKLPDPDGREQYKVMTFTNAVRGAMVRANGPLIVRATEWPEQDLAKLEDAASVLVLLHEYGHTLGDCAEFLGELGTSVEETNAEASAIYQTRRLAPVHLDALLHLGACWMPVQRALQGPTEAHSHADIVIFDALRSAGAVDVVETEDRWVVRLLSVESALQCAFGTALRMRLWEAGIPLAQQSALVEPFDADDREQDARVARAARAFLDQQTDDVRARMRTEVVAECKQYFALERLRRITEPLQRVLDCMPRYQSVAVIPTDRRFGSVLAV